MQALRNRGPCIKWTKVLLSRAKISGGSFDVVHQCNTLLCRKKFSLKKHQPVLCREPSFKTKRSSAIETNGNRWKTNGNLWKSNQNQWKAMKTSGGSIENQRNPMKTHRIPMDCKENARILLVFIENQRSRLISMKLKECQNHAGTMPEPCQSHARTMPGTMPVRFCWILKNADDLDPYILGVCLP